MKTQMYFVSFRTDDGDSLDWFVEATGGAEAEKLWREHTNAEDYMADQEGPSVWLVPPLGDRPRVLPWDSCEGVEMAARAEQ